MCLVDFSRLAPSYLVTFFSRRLRSSLITGSPVVHGARLRFNWPLAAVFKYIGLARRAPRAFSLSASPLGDHDACALFLWPTPQKLLADLVTRSNAEARLWRI